MSKTGLRCMIILLSLFLPGQTFAIPREGWENLQPHLELYQNATFCESICGLEVPYSWGPSIGQVACGYDGVEYLNGFCPSSVFMKFYCFGANNVTGLRYGGNCGCPNDCMSVNGQGECVNGACECNVGWSGEDCSKVSCTSNNTCNGVGTCQQVNDRDTCVCDIRWTGTSCQTPVHSIPPVMETVNSTQYSSWDNYGNNHPIFNVSVVAQIKLTMAEEDLQFLLDPVNKNNRDYIHTDFWFYNGNKKHTISNVGARISGNISRNMQKKNWKIKFTAFYDDDDNEWEQVKALDLNGFQTDASLLRNPMSLDVDYSMNGVRQRMGWAELYINDLSFGYYLILEVVDGNFLKSRFGSNDGILYKCQANLTWIDANPASYANLNCGSSPCYQPETDEAEDYTALRNLLAVINLTPNATFAAELEKIFDVDLFIRTFVFEVATGNWDSLRNQNNFYLYLDPEDSLWKYFRHDMDASFGALPEMVPVGSNDIYHWATDPTPAPGRLLYDRILSVPEYKMRYSILMQELFDGFFDSKEYSNFWERAMSFQQVSAVSTMMDYNHYFDCGWTYENFVDSFYNTIVRPETFAEISNIDPGVAPWMKVRKETASKQLLQYFNSQ